MPCRDVQESPRSAAVTGSGRPPVRRLCYRARQAPAGSSSSKDHGDRPGSRQRARPTDAALADRDRHDRRRPRRRHARRQGRRPGPGAADLGRRQPQPAPRPRAGRARRAHDAAGGLAVLLPPARHGPRAAAGHRLAAPPSSPPHGRRVVQGVGLALARLVCDRSGGAALVARQVRRRDSGRHGSRRSRIRALWAPPRDHLKVCSDPAGGRGPERRRGGPRGG